MSRNQPKEVFLDPKHYKPNKYDLHPKREDTKQRYLRIYEDFVFNTMTQRELAKKHKIPAQHVNRILKWAVSEYYNEIDPKIYREVFTNKLGKRSKQLEKMMKKGFKLNNGEVISASNVYELMAIIRELRLNDRLMAQAQGVLSTALVDKSDKRTINVMVKDLGRRGGVESTDRLEVEDKGKVIEISDSNAVDISDSGPEGDDGVA